MRTFTELQAEALITDPGTLKRGRELTKPANWSNLGRTATAAWGECAGSGKNPYLVGLDLADMAFKCSCPSRVFPCKHGAGLLLVLARQPDLLPAAEPPAWLAEWLGKRQNRQDKQVEKAAESPAETAPKSEEVLAKDTAARDKRETQRLERMQRGVADLATWLTDLIRTGLAMAPTQPASFWEQAAARLVDDQLPGLAARVRALASLSFGASDWPDRLLDELGELLLLTTAFRRWESQPPVVQTELAQQVGWALKKEEVLGEGECLTDTWQVLVSYTREVPENPRLEQRTTWLLGRTTHRLAQLLDFSAAGQPYATHYASLSVVAGEVVFYPGLLPLRAIPGPDGLTLLDAETQLLPAPRTIPEVLDDYATALGRNPWLREYPVCVAAARLVPEGDRWWAVQPETDARLPMEVPGFPLGPYDLLAEGGPTLHLFGTWDGRLLRVLIGAAPDDLDVTYASAARVGGEPVFEAEPTEIETESPLPRWEDLRRTALVGSRQGGPLPALGATLPLAPAADAETQLLLAAGSLGLMRRAGHVPPPAGAVPPLPTEAETRPEGPAAVARCLRAMLVEDAPIELVPDYLQKLDAHGWRVPPARLIVTLIWAGRHGKGLDYVPRVLGARGRWVAGLNPDWQHLTATSEAFLHPTVWETGALPERRRYLTSLLATDPAQARALLAAVLPQEPAKAQVELLGTLANQVSAEDEALLEPLLKSRSKEVRQTAARLLARVPDAALVARVWARTAPLMQLKKGLLGLGKPTLEITLPGEWSKDWLLDGIEERAEEFRVVGEKDQALGERSMRLGSMLALLPPARWAAHLRLSAAELIDITRLSEWAMPLLPGWASAAVLHQDVDWATALLGLHLDPPFRIKHREVLHQINWQGLARVVPRPQWEQTLLKPLISNLDGLEDWPEKVRLVAAPWPAELTRAVLRQLQQVIARPPNSNLWYLHGFCQTLGRYLIADEDTAWTARSISEMGTSTDYQLTKWLQELSATLEFRHELQLSLQAA